MAIQRGNAASFLGTIPWSKDFKELFMKPNESFNDKSTKRFSIPKESIIFSFNPISSISIDKINFPKKDYWEEESSDVCSPSSTRHVDEKDSYFVAKSQQKDLSTFPKPTNFAMLSSNSLSRSMYSKENSYGERSSNMSYRPLELVCLPEVGRPISVTVRDMISQPVKKQSFIHLMPSKTIYSIFTDISRDFEYNVEEIELVLQRGKGDIYVLNNNKNKTKWTSLDCLSISIGLLRNNSLFVQDSAKDDLLLSASASPTTGEGASNSCNIPPIHYNDYDNGPVSMRHHLKPIIIDSTNYVGLVNQAMTCYLNSLLQALYMTPEFRNALYNWEFDGVNESRSIPYQLQKLFVNLQTSSKSAVKTIDLTISFWWQNRNAWHQHDIEELCRVLFDALKQTFRDSKQANLINDLYEGKMLDCIKCLECDTVESRKDTFLDIPLPVRPFGSAVAYNSVQEAMGAFVQPETLDGNNQYQCEKCNKKCVAHKGSKFTKFPFLLTIHLKRFDFDYNTMHR